MKEEFLFIKAKKKLHKIMLSDVIYIEAMDDYIRIQLRDQKDLISRMTMKSMHDQLDPQKFIRVHRSFIVPVKNIEAVGSKNINVSGIEIALGKSYAAEVIERFKQEA